MPPMLALGYCRVSTDRQEEEGTSLQTQEAAIRAYCLAHGYTPERVYTDTHTGSEWRERPGLTKLRDHLAANPKAGYVVVAHALDRLSRSQTAIAVLVDLFEQHGARLELVTEAFEDSATGRFIRNAKAFAAEVEREKIIERVQRGMLRYMQSGKRVPGRSPGYGLRWLDERHQGAEAEPGTVDVVRLIFSLAADGFTLMEIARKLTESHIPTPTGRDFWHSSSVGFILKNPIYTGKVIARRWQHGRRRGKWFQVQRPESEQIPLTDWPVEPVIEPETWQAAQSTLRRNRITRRVHSAPDAFLLRGGFALCGACGHPLSAQRGPFNYYRCQVGARFPERCDEMVYMRADELDAAVWDGDGVEWLGAPKALEIAEQQEDWAKAEPKRARVVDRTARESHRLDGQIAALRRALALAADADATSVLLSDLTVKLAQRRALTVSEPPRPARDFSALRALLAGNPSYAFRRRVLEILEVKVRVRRHPSKIRGRPPVYQIESLLTPHLTDD